MTDNEFQELKNNITELSLMCSKINSDFTELEKELKVLDYSLLTIDFELHTLSNNKPSL